MNDETGFIAAVLRELAASTAVILAAWGALGGATNALTTKMRLRDAIRHILLGGLIAAGMGSVSMALVTSWLGLPPEAVPAGYRIHTSWSAHRHIVRPRAAPCLRVWNSVQPRRMTMGPGLP